MTTSKQTYNSSIKELEQIVDNLENNTHIDLDEIKSQIEKGASLINYCKKELYQVNKKMTEILKNIEE